MTIDRDRYDRLHAFARKVVLHDPEDLVQDHWLADLEQPQVHTDAYLERAVKYRWLARYRSDSRRRSRESAWALGGHETAAPVELLALERALGRLGIEQRRLIEARFIEGREPREIAAQLGLSSEVVRQRMHRALLSLRRELEGEQRRVVIPLVPWRRWFGWSLLGGMLTSVAVAALVCVEPNEDDTHEPEHVALEPDSSEPSTASLTASESTPSTVPARPEVAAPQSESAHLLGAAWLLDQYREGYGALMKEVQASFIECLTEHNQNPPAIPVEMTGKTLFRVQLRSEPDTGVFAETIDIVEDTHAARDLIECIGESLPTLAIPQPSLEVPDAVLVVVDRTKAFTTIELDLAGMPADLRDDIERVRRLSRYLTKWEAPAWAEASLAEFALALGDGAIEAGEVSEASWATLRRLEDPAPKG